MGLGGSIFGFRARLGLPGFFDGGGRFKFGFAIAPGRGPSAIHIRFRAAMPGDGSRL